jgi:hypothetical protein
MKYELKANFATSTPMRNSDLKTEFLHVARQLNYDAIGALGARDYKMAPGFKVTYAEQQNSIDVAYGKWVTPEDTNNTNDTIEIVTPATYRHDSIPVALSLPAANQAVVAGAKACLWHVRVKTGNAGTRIIDYSQATGVKNVYFCENIAGADFESGGVGTGEKGVPFLEAYVGYVGRIATLVASTWYDDFILLRNIDNKIKIRIGTDSLGTSSGIAGDANDAKITLRLVRYAL